MYYQCLRYHVSLLYKMFPTAQLNQKQRRVTHQQSQKYQRDYGIHSIGYLDQNHRTNDIEKRIVLSANKVEKN